MTQLRSLLSLAFLGTALAAQQPEPATLGVQARASFPQSGLSDAVGGGTAPGLGASLVAEMDLAQWFEGWRARLDLGMDVWFWGNLTQLPGKSGRVSAGHVSGELVRFLRPGGTPVTLGPYLTLGAGMYAWSGTRVDSTLGKVDMSSAHPAGILGCGWRMNKSLDLEVKVLMGKIDPQTTALAAMAAATWRF